MIVIYSWFSDGSGSKVEFIPKSRNAVERLCAYLIENNYVNHEVYLIESFDEMPKRLYPTQEVVAEP